MSKVWTYIISKPLNAEQLNELLAAGKEFISKWTAHENRLSGGFTILNDRIIIVNVNEDVYGASGCSIDKLTRFVKTMESAFNVELLNRMLVAYKSGEKIEVVRAAEVKNLLDAGTITENTEVYNTSVATGAELINWLQPLKDTWLNKYLQKV